MNGIVSRDAYEYRSTLKVAKREISRGRASKAEYALLRANELANHLKSDEKRAFVSHRLAEVSVMFDDSMNARKRFKHALELIDKQNKVGYARLLRDYGNFERIQGQRKIGRRNIEQAIDLLESIENRNSRVAIELIVTEAFLARFDLGGDRHADALETLRVTADKLRGYKKKAYELANLTCLIDTLPVLNLERAMYIRRAVELSIRLKNFKRAGELTALLGGNLPRDAYNFIVNR